MKRIYLLIPICLLTIVNTVYGFSIDEKTLDSSNIGSISIIPKIINNLKSDNEIAQLQDESGKIFLKTALSLAGFTYTKQIGVYTYKRDNLSLEVDLNRKTIKKGEIIFNIKDIDTLSGKGITIEKAVLEKIINQNIIFTNKGVLFQDFVYEPHGWTEVNNGLIAHAAGGISDIDGTNSYEALIFNYANGHTVFEVDLRLTSDNVVVAIHDWERYNGKKTHTDYMSLKIKDTYSTMDFDTLLSFMAVNKDMYLVTDTKSFEDSKEELVKQFKIMLNQALEKGEGVVERIIPQIYNQEMYYTLTELYPFKSIIYTLYESPDTNEEVIDFVKDKEAIKVVTMGPYRLSEDFLAALTKHDKYVYLFTLNDIEDVESYLDAGVHGIYTDFILPSDL